MCCLRRETQQDPPLVKIGLASADYKRGRVMTSDGLGKFLKTSGNGVQGLGDTI